MVRKLSILFIALLLLTSCKVHENLVSISISQTGMVEDYESQAKLLKKIAIGINTMCQDKTTKDCDEIKLLYNQTREVFIEMGNLAIEVIDDTSNMSKIMQYKNQKKAYEVLLQSLIIKAEKLGIGGLNK